MRFGIDRSHRVKHGALLDAQLLAQVYVELTGGRQIGLGLVADAGSVAVPLVGWAGRRSASRGRRGRTLPRPRNSNAIARLLPGWSTRSGHGSPSGRLTAGSGAVLSAAPDH